MVLLAALALLPGLSAPRIPTSLSVEGPGLRQGRTGEPQTPEEKANVARGERLSAIATQLQDPKSDTVALATEAMRLCGFVIWNEQREVVAQPTGQPRLGLAITTSELKAYSTLFRGGQRVKLSDFIGMFDLLLSKAEIKSVGPAIRKGLWEGTLGDTASNEAMIHFIYELGASASEEPNRRVALAEDPVLDSLQVLMLLRCITEEIRAAVMKYKDKTPLVGLLASAVPVYQQGMLPGWAEDAVVTAQQFGVGKAVEMALEQAIGESQSAFISRMDLILKSANVGLLIAKVAGIYMSLTGDVSCPTEPLVRTKDQFKGGTAMMNAVFKIDSAGLSNYLKDNRFAFTLLGVDVDQPRSEKLKGVETEWKMQNGNSYDAEDIVHFTAQDPSKVRTDATTGIATIQVEGKGRQQSIAQEPVLLPHMKKVWVWVTPQVKATDILQDLVDAANTAAAGPLGILTFISECLFRMKWCGTERHQLLVKDWWVVRNQATVSINIKARATGTTSNGMWAQGIDRGLRYADILMMDQSIEAPPPIDWSTIPDSPSKRLAKQGYDAQVEAAKRLLFMSDKKGTVETHVHDYSVNRGQAQECGGPYRYWNSMVTDGSETKPFVSLITDPVNATGMLMVAIREDQKKVWITADAKLKGTSIASSSSGGSSTPVPFEGRLLDRVELDPQFSERETYVVPLLNTQSGKDFKQWSGSVPFTFNWTWTNPPRRGTGTVEYNVIRKLVNKK